MTIADQRARRIVLIGQAPGAGEDRGPLVGGVSGGRLQALAGMTILQYCRAFERRNLIPYYPGRARGGRGDFFPRIEARIEARKIARTLIGRRVIFVGIAVAEAFDIVAPRPFQWYLCRSADMLASENFYGAAIPHPSGLNHFWNSPANVAEAREFFAKALGLPYGETRPLEGHERHCA
jgi:uracil-DNA glycosylase